MKVTSRERPEILLETVKQYVEKANDIVNMRWLFSFDEDDKKYYNDNFLKDLFLLFDIWTDGIKLTSLIFIGPLIKGNVRVCFGKSYGKIHAINRDVNSLNPMSLVAQEELNEVHWDILLNISDDQRPIIHGYDHIIRAAMPDDLDASLWFTDGQPRVNTQEIVGRKYYNRFGYIYHPDYKSLFSDNEATEVAKRLGKQIKSNQQIVKHFHPAWGGTQAFKRDALYDRNDKFWNEDQATYKRRELINFGL